MILILTQCFPPTSGGIEGLMGGLAFELAANGKEVLVYADAHVESAGFDQTMRDRYAIRRFGGLKPLRRRLKARAAAKIIRSGGVEGVFADSWKSLEMLDQSVLRQAGLPVIVWSHGNEYPAQPNAAKHNRISNALSAATKVLANSRYTQDRIAQYVPPGVETVVRHPPIDMPVQPEAEDTAWAEALWDGAEIRLISVSRLDPRKGLDTVIRCLPELAKSNPSIRFVIAGPGEDRDRLKGLADDLGVAEHVRFAGRVDGGRKSALYATADLFVMPTRAIKGYAETFGIVFPEAAFFGVPAIAGEAGGSADAVEDGKAGLLCDGNDQAAVAAALDRMVLHDALRETMGKAALERGAAAVWPLSIGPFLKDVEPAEDG